MEPSGRLLGPGTSATSAGCLATGLQTAHARLLGLLGAQTAATLAALAWVLKLAQRCQDGSCVRLQMDMCAMRAKFPGTGFSSVRSDWRVPKNKCDTPLRPHSDAAAQRGMQRACAAHPSRVLFLVLSHTCCAPPAFDYNADTLRLTVLCVRQSEQKGAAIEAAPYEDWMSPALSVLQEDSESVSSGTEEDHKGGKRKRASGGPKVVYTQKRAAVMAPPPARVAGREKELLLAKMKSLVQQAEAAESPAEKRRLLAEIKALQKGAKKKTARQEEAKTGQKTDTPGETDTHPEKAGVEDETEADV